MFGLTTLETRLAGAAATFALLLVVVIGFAVHERHKGSAACISKENSAETSQEHKDAKNAAAAINDFNKDLSDIPAAVSSASHMLMCIAPAGMPSRSTARPARPIASAVESTGISVLPGDDSRRQDFGGGVQDITLSCMLQSADATELWRLAIKEATK